MTKLDTLRQKVQDLYAEKQPTRADWADWLYDNHVVLVAKYAKELAEKYEANAELAEVAALLHDIADHKVKRFDPNHEEESLTIARQVMEECRYTTAEIELVVEDAIRYHSCHGHDRPKSKEGLVLATADSLAHLKTDFYIYATHAMGRDSSLDEVKQWVLKKIDRDFNNKLCFDDERENCRPDYEIIKTLFSR